MTALSRNRTLLAIVAICVVTLALTILARPRPLPVTAPPLAPPPAADASRLPISGQTYAIDAASSDGRTVAPPALLTAHAGAKVTIVGWALDSRNLVPAAQLTIAVDKLPSQPAAAYHEPRPDVAKALGNPDAQLSGFHTVVDLGGLAPGRHTLTLATVGEDKQVRALPTPVEILIR